MFSRSDAVRCVLLLLIGSGDNRILIYKAESGEKIVEKQVGEDQSLERRALGDESFVHLDRTQRCYPMYSIQSSFSDVRHSTYEYGLERLCLIFSHVIFPFSYSGYQRSILNRMMINLRSDRSRETFSSPSLDMYHSPYI